MTDKEIETEVRRWLEYTLNKGSYDSGAMLALKNLYYNGRADVQNQIKNALDVQECFCDR